MLTQERLKELLHYDPETGAFTWKVNKGRGKAGCVAGSQHTRGYIQIKVNGGQYLTHRLAWFYVHGVWPEVGIDHIDRDRTNNALSNLRPATQKQNLENAGMRSDNTSGFRGVCWNKDRQKWQAGIHHHGKTIHLGLFHTVDDAAAAAHVARNKLFTHHKE